MPIEFGYALPAGPPRAHINEWIDDLAAQIKLLGEHFTSLWMTDHFFWEDRPTYEAWTTLAYIAARWPEYTIGPMVLGQSYRNPALLAKMGATLQMLTGGKLIMGIGAGWKEDEYHAYGYPYPRPGVRIAQLADQLEIFRRMWTTPGPVSYAGEHYHIQDAYCEPRPDPVPPLLVGGGGYKTIGLAVKYADIWNIHDMPWAEYAKRLDIIVEHCADQGRDPATLRLSWFGRLAVAPTEDAAIALSNGKWTRANAFVGTPQQVLDLMGPFIEAGVDYFMVEPLGMDDPDLLHLLKEDVLPAIKQMGE